MKIFEHFPLNLTGRVQRGRHKGRRGRSIALCLRDQNMVGWVARTKILILCTKGCIIIPFQPPRRLTDCSGPISNDTNVCITLICIFTDSILISVHWKYQTLISFFDLMITFKSAPIKRVTADRDLKVDPRNLTPSPRLNSLEKEKKYEISLKS